MAPQRDNIPTRHNNPLNIKVGGATRKWLTSGDAEVGDAATDGGSFLRFKSSDKGFEAARDLLFHNKNYSDTDLESAMRKWSGGGYGAEVYGDVDKSTPLRRMSSSQQDQLVANMAKREGWASGSAKAAPVKAKEPSLMLWTDVASHLDPMMSANDYESVRRKYFMDVVLPQIPRNQDIQGLFREFKKRTERPALLTGTERLQLRAGIAASSAMKAFTEPLQALNIEGWRKQDVQAQDEKLQPQLRLAEREGMSVGLETMGGAMVGELPAIMASFAVAGPVAGALTARAGLMANTAVKVKNLLAGGLAFGALDAAKAENGDRVWAGAKGFAEGLLWTLPIVPFLKAEGLAKTTEEATQLLETAMREPAKVPEAVHEAIAKATQQEAKIASSQEVLPNSIVRNPRIRGILVGMLPKESKGGVVYVEVKTGRESEALEMIRGLQLRGSEFAGIQFNPNSEDKAWKFLRQARDSEIWKYEDSVIIDVQRDMAEQVATQAMKEGVPATALSNRHVELSVKRAPAPPEEVDLTKQLEESLAAAKVTELPEGVTFKVRQSSGEPGKHIYWYDLEVEPGKKVPFALAPGGNLTEKIAKTREKWASKPAVVEEEAGAAGRMTTEQASELASGAGYDPTKVDLEAIQDLGKEEFTRLLEVRARTREVGEKFDPLQDWMEKVARAQSAGGGKSSAIDLKGLSVAERKKHYYQLEDELRAKYKSGELPEAEYFDKLEDLTNLVTDKAVSVPWVTKHFAESKAQAVELPLSQRLFGRKASESVELPGQAIPESAANAMRVRQEVGTIAGKRRELKDVAIGDPFVEGLRRRGVGQIVTPQMRISLHPFRASIEVTPETFARLSPGAKASLYHQFRTALAELGVPMASKTSEMYPAMMFTKDALPEEKFHEFLHAAVVKSGLLGKVQDVVPRDGRLHAFAIASHLEKHSVYAGKPFADLLDEAYTYAASAIRYGKTEYGQSWLEQLTKWNGTEAQIREFVRGTSENILKYSQGKMDDVSQRILQRKMTDMIRRSDANVTYNITSSGESARWNPEQLGWTMSEEGGETTLLKNVDDVWDYLFQKDVSDVAPSFSYGLEALGVRGPMSVVAPMGKPPLPTVGIQPGERWTGWSAASGWFRPFLPWVASLDKKINKALVKRGEKFPLFEKLKAADDQVRQGDQWLIGSVEKLGDILKGTSDKKHHDIFASLTYSPKDFGMAASKLGLTPKDIDRAKAMEGWLTNFRDETGIPVFEWLRETYPRLQAYKFAPEALWAEHYDPRSAGVWEKAVREKELNPADTHMGRFANWLMREGFEKKYTGEPLKELQKLLNHKVVDGRGLEKNFLSADLQWPLQNYIKTVQGIPDQTQMVVNKGMKNFVGYMQDKIKLMNAHLPEGMKIPGSEANISPRLLQRLMTLTYASALGLRPAVAVRDGLQVLSTTLPVLGARKMARGMELMFSKKGRQIVEDAGAFIGKTNLGEVYGDILGEVPIEGRIAQTVHDMANVMMAPSRWGDNFSRGITFLGEYDHALQAIKDLRAGKMTQAKFLRKTSLWFMDDQMASQLLTQAQTSAIRKTMPTASDALVSQEIKDVAKRIALETVDLTQWPFRRGTQPAVLRTGVGRIFGQFGRWPANYADFLARLYQKSKGGEYRSEAMRSAVLWAGANYAAAAGLEGLGADVSKWFFVSPAGYSASPHADLVMNLLKSPEESDEGRAARKAVLEYPLNFIPARVEMNNILDAMEEMGPGVGLMDPRLLRVLGFKPAKQMPDVAPEDLLQYETGFGRR